MADELSNPAPLGLMGFGMTTVLLNLHNAGIYQLTGMILAMGLFYGGLAQIIAGILEYKRGNTFGTTAFTSYGLFWWTLVLILILPNTNLWAAVTGDNSESIGLGFYFLMWGIFTGFMFIGTLKNNLALQVVFGTLTLLFLLLAIEKWTGLPLGPILGWEGVFCGFSAIYLAMAEVLNEVYGKTILPIGAKKPKEERSE
ncbi:MAG: acetate uptake transporter [Promethearchaeota archaeon]